MENHNKDRLRQQLQYVGRHLDERHKQEAIKTMPKENTTQMNFVI